MRLRATPETPETQQGGAPCPRPVGAVTGAYRQAFSCQGRATRSEFWWFVLFAVIATQALNLGVDTIAPQAVLSIVSLSACLARRMCDAGRHRRWAVPEVAFLVGGPLFVGFGFAQELVEADAAFEATGEEVDSPLLWVGFAYGVTGIASLPAFIFCFLAGAPLPATESDEAAEA